MQQQLIDNYQRRFKYLRLSLTELCNFRCQYCLPNGYHAMKPANFLNLNEIDHVVSAFVDLGVSKIRLTGGEPTLRRDFLDIISTISQYSQISDLAVTTNGSRVLKSVHEWQKAGLTSINISVDSFSPNIFKLITGQNKLIEIQKSVERSLEVGIKKVKINTVLMKGLNDSLEEYLNWIKTRPITLRFIELMETGLGRDYFSRFHISGFVIEKQLLDQGWQLEDKESLAGPAKVYSHIDYQGKIGLIMPYSKDFCQSCNRLRISSTGKFHYCLFGESAIDLRPFLQSLEQLEQLKSAILSTLSIKPETHFLHQHKIGITENLSHIGG